MNNLMRMKGMQVLAGEMPMDSDDANDEGHQEKVIPG